MNGRHRIARDPAPGNAHWRATALVQRLTGQRVCEHSPTRHSAPATRPATSNSDVAEQQVNRRA